MRQTDLLRVKTTMSDQASFRGPLPGSETDVSPPSSIDPLEYCEEHKEFLSQFCLDDLEPLCKHCAADSHAGHRVYILTEAAVDCKEELKTSLNGLNEKMNRFKQVVQTCQHASMYNQAGAKLTEELMKKEFENLHQLLRQEEAARQFALREEKEQKMGKAAEKINRMNQLIKSLEEKIQLIEGELDSGGEGDEFLQHYQSSRKSNQIGHMEPEKICRPLIDVAKQLGNLQYAVWEKIKHVAPYTPVTLDPRTAGHSLRVSPELNYFQLDPRPLRGFEQHMGEVVPVPANPERFQPDSRILAREGFSSGVFCWSVEVSDSKNWTVGVAAESVSRKEEFEACPEAGLWCISLRDEEYRALTTPSQILHLSDLNHLNRVRVRLDCEGGILEFRNADTDALLFTFRHHFTEKVYPYFESVSVGGSISVLEQSVNISVDSVCVPGKVWEDEAIENKLLTASTNIKKVSGQLTEGKKESAICSVNEDNPTTPSKKENTSSNETKPKRKTRFNETYHVSLYRALKNLNMCGNQTLYSSDK